MTEETAQSKALQWARDNLKPGLEIPFLGTCLTASLLLLQREHPEHLENTLMVFWGVLDKQVLTPALHGKKLDSSNPNLTASAIFLALNDYFTCKGNFKSGVDGSLRLFKLFGVSKEEELIRAIDEVARELTREFVAIFGGKR